MKILKPLAALVFALWSGPALAACGGENLIALMSDDRRAALEAAVAQHPYPEGNLWRAERGGQTVHVVGTVHIPDPRIEPLVATVAPILADADLLILEATTAQQAEMQEIMTKRPEVAFLTEGPTLIDLLGDTLWARLSEDLSARGVPPFLAAKFRPWLLGMTLAVPQCAMAALTAGETGVDGRLEDLARADGTPIATLDDIEDLLAILNRGTLDEQVEMLKLSLMIEVDTEDAMATTLDSYFAGRHRELWEFSKFMASDADLDPAAFEAFEATLLVERNDKWAPLISDMIPGKDVVIAVGAAHLSGNSGVLRMLERLGYQLTRL